MGKPLLDQAATRAEPSALSALCSALANKPPGAVRVVGAVSLCLPTSERDRSVPCHFERPCRMLAPGISGSPWATAEGQMGHRREAHLRFAVPECNSGLAAARIGGMHVSVGSGASAFRRCQDKPGRLGIMFQDSLSTPTSPPGGSLPRSRSSPWTRTAAVESSNGGCTCWFLCSACCRRPPADASSALPGQMRAGCGGCQGAQPRGSLGQDHPTTQVTV